MGNTPVVADPVRLARMRARLNPILNEPFFEIADTTMQCNHTQRLKLDTINRRAICKDCGEAVEAFDALVIYAKGERRLLAQAHEIKSFRASEAEKKHRKMFIRDVVASKKHRDRRGHLESVELTLSCQHTQGWDAKRRTPRRATCYACATAAKTP